MLLREFVGVTYRRRFVFFKNQSIPPPSPAVFRRNLAVAAARQFRRMTISQRIWRRDDIRRPYLSLVLRHFFFGYLVQTLRTPSFLALLPPVSNACYYDFPPNLAAIITYNHNHREIRNSLLELITRLEERNERRLYVHALLTLEVFLRICGSMAIDRPALAGLISDHSLPGKTPLGVELEFSNLGRYATFDKPFKGDLKDPLFENMQYYEAFFLDDISWRLGGYLDTHIRGRGLFSLPRIGAQPGGFFEYSLVRLDYPRSFSMPLSLDPGLVALYIKQICDFIPEIRPHSLHVNFQKPVFGSARPELADYLCLLMLGGDLYRDEQGHWRERRLADNELRGVIQRRKHRAASGSEAKEVIEFAFLRLRSPSEQKLSYLALLMALKAFLYAYNLDLSCRDQVQGMLAWAHQPKALKIDEIDRFLANLRLGWRREAGHESSLPEPLYQEIASRLKTVNHNLVSG